MPVFEGLRNTVSRFFNNKDPALTLNDEENTNIDGEGSSAEEFDEEVKKQLLVSFVNKEFDRMQKERMPYELQWQLNNNFLRGNQYCDINMQTQGVQEIPRLYWWQQREVFNHIAPIYETRLAKLGRVDLSLKVRPATNEQSDINTAKICTALCKGTMRQQEMQIKTKKANAWSELIGTVLYKNTWNTSSGTQLAVIDGDNFSEGGIEVTIVPAYEFYPDSNFSEDIDTMRCCIHAKVYSTNEIEEKWGVKVEGREIPVFNLKNSNISLGGLGYTASIQTVNISKQKDSEVVKEYYENTAKKYLNGRLIIVAGETLLYEGELPSKIGEQSKVGIPFVKQVCVENPGYFWGTAIIERCIPIQRAYNAVKNRKHEYLNRVAIGAYSVENGALDTDELQEDGISPGKIVTVERGFNPPRPIENGVLPSVFPDEETKLLNEFVQISGVSELSRDSTAPSGVGSGVALEILKEQDDTRLSLTAENIRLAIIKVGKHWLRLSKQYATFPRMLRYIGDDNDVAVIEWEANDITSDDIVIETENELAQTPAQRKQMVVDLLQYGLFNNPETGNIDKSMRGKIFEMLQLGNWEAATELENLHANRANKENIYLKKGTIPQIQEYDEHAIHIVEHNKYRLTTDFEELASQNLELVQLFNMHVKQHEAYIQQAIQALNMQQE